VGSSHYAARLAAATLIRHWGRARVQVVACTSMDIGHSVFPAREDWCIAITHRGKTPCTLQALATCEASGAFTICVAGQGVAEPQGARLTVATTPLERVEPHTMSMTGAICAITSLLLGNPIAEEWDMLRGLGDPNLEMIRERAGHGARILLGEWEGEWLAREGALKLIEMARVPARAYGTEEFFHGPRYAWDPSNKEDRIWHLSLPKDQRNDEVRAALRVHVPTGSTLAWVPALVELQWLALGAALNLGVDPDSAGR
jgi:glucosamine 6-phosphate synthetase-like amidotransferase/phosphosugar isomerase protein